MRKSDIEDQLTNKKQLKLSPIFKCHSDASEIECMILAVLARHGTLSDQDVQNRVNELSRQAVKIVLDEMFPEGHCTMRQFAPRGDEYETKLRAVIEQYGQGKTMAVTPAPSASPA